MDLNVCESAGKAENHPGRQVPFNKLSGTGLTFGWLLNGGVIFFESQHS